MAGGAADRAGPLAVDLDQAEARRLEPAQDPLGLLGGGRRRRPGAAADRLGAGDAGRRRRGGRRRPAGSPRPRRAGRGGRRAPPSDPPRGSSSRRAATSSGHAGQGREPLGAGGRADERGQPVAVDARPPRSARRRRGSAIRRVIASTTSSGRLQEVVAQLAHHGGVGRGVDAAVARGQAAAHLGQHARRHATGCRPSRSVHWRIGKVSCRAARHFSAVRLLERTGRGSRRRRRRTRRTSDSRGQASRVSLSQWTFSGKRERRL